MKPLLLLGALLLTCGATWVDVRVGESTTVHALLRETMQERQQGLMGRKEPLKENEGMLFLFHTPQEATFHMIHTYLSLDLLFFDEKGTLVTFYEKTLVDQGSYFYPSHQKIKWALEVPAGWIKKEGVKRGMSLQFVSHKYLQSAGYHPRQDILPLVLQ